jgi:hypothetical protein
MSNEITQRPNRYNNQAAYVQPATIEIVNDEPVYTPVIEAAMIDHGQRLAGIALNGHTTQSRAAQSDTAITHAQAHLIATLPAVGAVVAITTGLVLIAGLALGGPVIVWIGLELAIFGVGALVVLTRGRRQGLEHTPAGVERHEIDARARIAMHAIDRHCEALERVRGVRG